MLSSSFMNQIKSFVDVHAAAAWPAPTGVNQADYTASVIGDPPNPMEETRTVIIYINEVTGVLEEYTFGDDAYFRSEITIFIREYPNYAAGEIDYDPIRVFTRRVFKNIFSLEITDSAFLHWLPAFTYQYGVTETDQGRDSTIRVALEYEL